MSFNDNIRLDPSRVGTSGAGRKIAGAGGGSLLGVLLILGFSYLCLLYTSGDTFESAPQGVAVAKADAQLTEAVQKAMQYLMDNGYLNDILASYGAENAALTTATLNPSVN